MPAFNHTDLSTFTTEQLIQELESKREALEIEESKLLDCDQYVRRALQLRVTEIRRWIAIHNTRATEAIEGMPEERLVGFERSAAKGEDFEAHHVAELLAEVRRLRGNTPRGNTPPAAPHDAGALS